MKKSGILALLASFLLLVTVVAPAPAATLDLSRYMKTPKYEDVLKQKVSLKKGNKGENVSNLISSLSRMSYDEEVSLPAGHEKYDSKVEKMVKSFQGMNRLKMTGKITPEEYAMIRSREKCWEYDINRIPMPDWVWWRKYKGQPTLGFDIINCSTKYTIDAYDFVLIGYNVYGEEIFDETYYSNENCKIGPLKKLSGKKKFYLLPDCGEPRKVSFAVYRFHTKEGGTVDIPRSEWNWVDYDINW